MPKKQVYRVLPQVGNDVLVDTRAEAKKWAKRLEKMGRGKSEISVYKGWGY